MVKVLDFPGGGSPQQMNVATFSVEIENLIRAAIEARALHPAEIVGVLTYHANGVCHSCAPAFRPPPGPQIIAPPPGFKP